MPLGRKLLTNGLLALALAPCAAVGVPAQDGVAGGVDTDYTAFDLGQLMDMDVVYGASSYDQKLTDAPAAVTVITADEIQAHGYRTLADVLASVRGFHITYDRSYEYIGVRGFGRPGDYNTRVLILHDGHPANDVIYGTAPIGGELAVDLSLVRRIEVIRGPGSALYGAGAFFAVINLVTWDGAELDGAEVAVNAGSRRLLGGQATWGGRLGRDGGLLLAAQGLRDDGDDIRWPEYADPATNDGLFVNGDREELRHAFGKVRLGEFQATAAWARRDKRIPTGEWEMIFNDTGAAVRDARLAVSLSGSRALSPAASVRARLGFDDYKCVGEYPFDMAEEGQPADRLVQHEEAHGRWWSGELQAAGEWNRHRLVAGAGFSRSTNVHQSSGFIETAETLLDIRRELDNAGVYLQDEWSAVGDFSLYLGLRYDDFRSFGSHMTPRCGLVAHPGTRTTAKLLYGEAFRAPNAYELYYADGISQKGSPDLEPEQIRTWELVLEQDLAADPGTEIRLGLSVFDNAIDGLVEQVVDPVDDLLVFRNIGDARTYGAEVDLDARLLPGLRGRLSFSAQRAEDRATGALLTNAPARLFKLNLTTPRQGVKLAGALELLHTSRRLTLAGSHAAPYLVANLDLTWWTPVKGLQADLAVDNLLGQRYADPGAEHQLQDVLAREGRLVRARLGWRW